MTEAEKQFYQAVNKFEQGDIAAAADLFSDIVLHYPENGRAYSYLGIIYFRNFKDTVAAESNFKKAVLLSPEFSESYIHYASLLLSQERFAEMNANLNKVSEIPGVNKSKVFELFGMMHEVQGRLDDAIGFYKRAITSTFSDDDLTACEKAISRCNTKKKYL